MQTEDREDLALGSPHKSDFIDQRARSYAAHTAAGSLFLKFRGRGGDAGCSGEGEGKCLEQNHVGRKREGLVWAPL